MEENIKLSSTQEYYENSVTNMKQTALEESTAESTDKTDTNFDFNVSKIEAAKVSDQAVTFEPTNGPLPEEASLTPSVASSTSEFATLSASLVASETTYMASKEETNTSIIIIIFN